MKKRISLLLVLTLMATLLVACGGEKEEVKEAEEVAEVEEVEETKEEVKEEEEAGEEGFTEEDGKLVLVDTESAPLEFPAMRVEVDKDAKIVNFMPADDEGNVGADYYSFNLEENEFEKYYYVSAMGTGHYYYYDLEAEELLRVEDNDHNDSTESTKESGRWDGAVEKIEDEISELESYFEGLEGKTIEDFINE